MLFTVLHFVAKQPIKNAKKSLVCPFFGGSHGYKECFSDVILMLLKDIIFLYILAIKKFYTSLSFIARQYKMQKCK